MNGKRYFNEIKKKYAYINYDPPGPVGKEKKNIFHYGNRAPVQAVAQ